MKRFAAAATVAVFFVVSCGGDSESTTTLAPAEASTVLAEAGSVLQNIETVRFEILVDGEPVYVDGAELLAASAAEGQYEAPESFQAIVDVKTFGLSVELGAVSIGQDQWVTNPVTGDWEQLPPGYGFDPLTLFDPEVGLGATLTAGLADATFVGESTGVDEYTIAGVVAGDRVAALTAGLVEEPEVTIVLTIDADSHEVKEATFDTGGGASHWTVRFSEFNEPVSIESPETS
jgi:lipoprotein LprG